MSDVVWIGIEEGPQTAQGWAFDGAGQVAASAHGDSAAQVQAHLGDAGALIVSDRAATPARPVPATILPQAGAPSPLSQDAPPGLLPATACLRLSGALAQRPNWDGVALLPDADKTQWTHVSAGEVVSFASFLTPRLSRLLGGDGGADAQALGDTMARPERLAAHLAQADLGGNVAAILGHLIGAELAAARPYWLGQQIILIGDDPLAEAYSDALSAQGARPERLSAADAAQAGLAALHRRASHQ